MAEHATAIKLKRLIARRDARNTGWAAFEKSARRSALRMALSQDRGL